MGQGRHMGEVGEHLPYGITLSSLIAHDLPLQPSPLCRWLTVGA